nr:haloalkane dehalogenase 1 [Quercus suber]
MPVLPPFTEHRIPRTHGSVYVRDFPGSEPAFVALHGFPDNSHIYDHLIPHLSKAGRRVITIDFLGFGASDKPSKKDYDFRQQLGDVEVVVDALSLGKVIPVGHDSGGPAAINFSLQHPDRTASVVLFNTFYGDAPGLLFPEIIDFFSIRRLSSLHHYIMASPQQFGWLFGFQRVEMQKDLSDEQKVRYSEFLGPLIDDNFRQTPSALPAFVSMTSHLSEELAANTARLADMRKTRVPFTLIWGKTDPYLHVTVAEHMQSQLQSCTLRVLEAGHWPQIDQAATAAEIMVAMRSE